MPPKRRFGEEPKLPADVGEDPLGAASAVPRRGVGDPAETRMTTGSDMQGLVDPDEDEDVPSSSRAAAAAAAADDDDEEEDDAAIAASAVRAPAQRPPILTEAQKAAKQRREAVPEATPAPNLAVGVSARDTLIQTLLRIFAKSDFKHDFGERVLSRDWITYADRTRFAEMVQRFPVKQRVDMLNKFDAMFKGAGKGKNLLELLHPGIAKQLYPDPDSDKPNSEFITEEEVLKYVGFNYDGLKTDIRTHFSSSADPFKKDYPIKREGVFSRNYQIGAQYYKNADGSTRNLASLFKNATGDAATKFAILVDASLGMSVSSIGDSTLKPDPGVPCEIVVLQNVESDGDSATGVSDFKIVKGGKTPTTVRMMRDVSTTTVVYPIWNSPAGKRTEAENLFSKIQIILNRVEAGEVEASIILGDESHTIPDLGTTSNVKNASLNGLAAWFAKEILTAANRRPADERKPYIYALIKRMGDWCQALSLLDRIRAYTPIDPKTKQPIPGGKSQTLQDLITQGYEVGLVTNDRILLAYALVLGLNVYFTTASDMNCLVYFKNKDDIADEAALATNADTNYGAFQQLFTGLKEAVALDVIKANITSRIFGAKNAYSVVIPDTPNYDSFITELNANLRKSFINLGASRESMVLDGLASAFRTKVILSNIKELRTNFDEIEAEIMKCIDTYNDTSRSPKEKYGASISLVNLANRVNTDIAHNRFTIDRLKKGEFASQVSSKEGGFSAQQNVFVDLSKKMDAGGRIASADIMMRAKDVILSCRDDIKEVLQKKIMIPSYLANYIPPVPTKAASGRPNDKDISNFEALYAAFTAVRAEIPTSVTGGQQGGGVDALFFSAILQREVFPYKSANFETTVNALEERAGRDPAAAKTLELLNSVPAVREKTYYRDEKSRPYSVIDRYLITKEDFHILIRILQGIIRDTTELVMPEDCEDEFMRSQFGVFRSALLYHDLLYERLEHVRDQSTSGEVVNPGVDYAIVPTLPVAPAAADRDGAAAMEEGSDVVLTFGKVDIEDKQTPEGAILELEQVAKEAALLRTLINRYVNEKTDAGLRSILKEMLKLFQSGNDAVANMTPAERVIAKQSVDANLSNVRDTIFGAYKPYLIRGVRIPGLKEGAAAARIETMIETGALPPPEDLIAPAFSAVFSPAPPPTATAPAFGSFGAPAVQPALPAFGSFGAPAVQPALPAFGSFGAPAVQPALPAFGSFGAPAAPAARAARAARGLQTSAVGQPTTNAFSGRSGSFTFGRGGRRNLYAGLRKRDGSGSPPSV